MCIEPNVSYINKLVISQFGLRENMKAITLQIFTSYSKIIAIFLPLKINKQKKCVRIMIFR